MSNGQEDSREARDQPSHNHSGANLSKEDLLRSRLYRKTVAKLQQRTGIAAIIVLVIVIWGLLVCLIVSHTISKIKWWLTHTHTHNLVSGTQTL